MQTKLIQWDFDAWEDYLYWQTQDRKILKKINQLVKDISRNPFEGIEKQKLEPLKENFAGFGADVLTRNTDVKGNKVLIFSCRGHYND